MRLPLMTTIEIRDELSRSARVASFPEIFTRFRFEQTRFARNARESTRDAPFAIVARKIRNEGEIRLEMASEISLAGRRNK